MALAIQSTQKRHIDETQANRRTMLILFNCVYDIHARCVWNTPRSQTYNNNDEERNRGIPDSGRPGPLTVSFSAFFVGEDLESYFLKQNERSCLPFCTTRRYDVIACVCVWECVCVLKTPARESRLFFAFAFFDFCTRI